MISYESSKWYIKAWRSRWYIYALFLHVKNYINVQLWLDYLLYSQIEEQDRKKLRIRWNEIKRHVELSKMYKFSSKERMED